MNYFLILSGVLCAWAMLSIISSERSGLISDLQKRIASMPNPIPAPPPPDAKSKAKPAQKPPPPNA